MNKQKGLSLIEVLIALVVLGTLAVDLPLLIKSSALALSKSQSTLRATHLAYNRMQIILGQKAIHGFQTRIENLDFCKLQNPPPICAIPKGYTIQSFLENSPNLNPAVYQQITVQVTGAQGVKVSLHALEGSF